MCGRLGYELIYTDIVLVFMKRKTGIETTDQYENIGHCKMSFERGYIAINPDFDESITSLRTAVAEEYTLDKELHIICRFLMPTGWL